MVTKQTIDALYEIIGDSFKCNRIVDRMVSVLGVKFAMNNTSKLIHQDIAHVFPKLADIFGEKCLERYNISVEYASTPDGKQDYSSAEQIIIDLKDVVVDYHTKVMGVIAIAQENGDYHVYTDMLDALKQVNEIVEQCILLEDKIKAYDSNMAFDKDIKNAFWILR